MAEPVLIRNARVLTLAGGTRLRRGKEMTELGVLPRGEILVQDGKIAAVGPKIEAAAGVQVIDAARRVIMPGFVDCHTHACFMNARLDEWEKNGARDRAVSTAAVMREVQEATLKQLAAELREKLGRMLEAGTTAAEVKSGYGSNLAAEVKQLRAIERASQDWPGTVVPTALLGHPVEGRNEEGDRAAAREMLHEIAQQFPKIAIDAIVDEGGWSLETALRLLDKASKHHPLRVHCDELKPLGMIAQALRLHARSVDHLEAATKADLAALAAAPDTCGVILPCTGFHATGRYARAGFLVDQGGAVALGTNFNPITAPMYSMPFAVALAVRFCGLTSAEAIVAATVNAAAVLGLKDRGTIEPGQRADLLILHHTDERALAYECGGNPVDQIFCAGAPMRVLS